METWGQELELLPWSCNNDGDHPTPQGVKRAQGEPRCILRPGTNGAVPSSPMQK